MLKSVLLAIALSLLLPASAQAAVTSTGSNGASISIAQSKFTKEMKIKVSGRNFDETVGIYLAYCVVPKKGSMPSPCGG